VTAEDWGTRGAALASGLSSFYPSGFAAWLFTTSAPFQLPLSLSSLTKNRLKTKQALG
jgi:hypothetical protein